MTKSKALEKQKIVAEKWNGRLAMIGLVAAAVSDLLTGHMFFWHVLMPELSLINDITPFQAILWCFYPIGFVVLIELTLRAINDDDNDDDQDGGGGVMSPVYQGV